MCKIAGTAAFAMCDAGATPLERAREFAAAKVALAGATLESIHAARRAVDASLPAYGSLTTAEQYELEAKVMTGINAAVVTGSELPPSPGVGLGAQMRSSWITLAGEAGPPGNALSQIQANWFFRKPLT